MEPEEIQEIVDQVTRAIRSIAHGVDYGPGGLEGLSMAIAGEGLRSPLSEAVQGVAESLSGIAEALDRIADLMEKEKGE